MAAVSINFIDVAHGKFIIIPSTATLAPSTLGQGFNTTLAISLSSAGADHRGATRPFILTSFIMILYLLAHLPLPRVEVYCFVFPVPTEKAY